MLLVQLRENNKFISQTQTTIQTEINKAIAKLKEDISKEINGLSQQNKKLQMDIELLKTRKYKIELKKEIKYLETKLLTPQIGTLIFT